MKLFLTLFCLLATRFSNALNFDYLSKNSQNDRKIKKLDGWGLLHREARFGGFDGMR